MTEDELIDNYPRLYHMAAEGTWPLIREHGLLTTHQLVDSCDPDPATRERVLDRVRKKSITLKHPTNGHVVVRDQAPLREHFLRRVLTDMTVEDWLNVLNGRVFFWLHTERLHRLLHAQLYRKQAHDVLTVDTAELLRAHGDRARLSAINSGATLYPNATPRGSTTFMPIEDYEWTQARRRRPAEAVAELAVLDGVQDIANHVVRVERRRDHDVLELLYER